MSVKVYKPTTPGRRKASIVILDAKKITVKKAWAPKKNPGEIWLMYKDVALRHGSGQVRKIISAWRYPGVSKPGEAIPIPEEIKQELLNNL